MPSDAAPDTVCAPREAPSRLRALAVLAALAPALMIFALVAYTLHQSHRQYRLRTELLTQNLAGALAQSLTANIEKVDLALSSIVDHLENQLTYGPLQLSDAATHVISQTSHRPEMEGIRVTDAQGLGILGPGLYPNPQRVGFADRSWFTVQRDNADAGLHMSQPLVSKISRERIISFSRRYRTPDGAFAGCVSAAVPLAYFQRQLQEVDAGRHGSVALRDAALGLIAHVSAAADEGDQDVGSTAVPQALHQLASGGLARATYQADSPVDGHERIYSLRRLGVAPLLVVVGTSSQDYLDDWMREARTVAALSGVFVLLYGGGATLLWRLLAQRRMARQHIQHLANHDTLTQLPNRVLLHGRLEQAMAAARRQGSELALLFIDMDRFKDINDTLGHPVGDGLLVEVGRRLVALVRESDIVARLGGDEFVVVLTGLQQSGQHAAAAVAGKVIAELGRPYAVRGHDLHSTPSIGIGVFPGDGGDADTLLKNADSAMYHAKSAGRNNFQFFTAAMNEAMVERLALEAGLRGAIERGELFLHYQPQLDLPTGELVGVEALLRWRHPEMGMIPPLKFIPVAEDTGQIEAIGAWVLDEALRQIALWRRAGHQHLRVAVNLSAQQLRGDAFAGHVSHALRRHGLVGDALELEITESMAMRDPERTAELLRELRQHGVALAIDDFGTGYSSLAYLKRLPLSCLKLDRSFVMDIEKDPNDAAICTATIQMAHSLGLGVVAEGVETQEQLDFLRRLGCDTVQGYFISRPLAARDCEEFLHRHTEMA